MNQRTSHLDFIFRKEGIYSILHIIILLLSTFLVVCISIDTFKNLAFYRQPQFMDLQLWICIIFLADWLIELIISPDRKRYLATHFLFFLVSVPYNAIISHFGWTFSPQLTYCLRYVPLVRGGYAMAIVVGWFTYNRVTGLFISYLATLLCTVYFSSRAFHLFGDRRVEHCRCDTGRKSAVCASRRTRHDDVPDLHRIRDEHNKRPQ